MELYKGFELYIDLDSKWYWRNPYIDAPVAGMLCANSKQDIKTIVDFMCVYYKLEETA
jgi:hypothetical protein